jgi:putative glycerol-1-phosphate prenyltransferase
MHQTRIYTDLTERHNGCGFFWLIDPTRVMPEMVDPRWERARAAGVSALLIGTSSGYSPAAEATIKNIRTHTDLPLILFPGSAIQVNRFVDAILFISLVSGRNPRYLIGEQVDGAPMIRSFGIEPIPTAYLLIESGATTAVQFISQTLPIPADKPDIAKVHALAAEYMGMKFVYLEAGSGAPRPVPLEMIRQVREYITIPLIVGGGLTSPQQVAEAAEAGADYVVVGSALEFNPTTGFLKEMAAAARPAAAKTQRNNG